jgi:hypothetical protein
VWCPTVRPVDQLVGEGVGHFCGDDAGATSCDGGTGSGDGLARWGEAGASFPWTSTGAGDQLVGRGLGG